MARHENDRPEPEKNAHSHTGDAFGYLARYFHKSFEKSGARGRTVNEARFAQHTQVQHKVPLYNQR